MYEIMRWNSVWSKLYTSYMYIYACDWYFNVSDSDEVQCLFSSLVHQTQHFFTLAIVHLLCHWIGWRVFMCLLLCDLLLSVASSDWLRNSWSMWPTIAKGWFWLVDVDSLFDLVSPLTISLSICMIASFYLLCRSCERLWRSCDPSVAPSLSTQVDNTSGQLHQDNRFVTHLTPMDLKRSAIQRRLQHSLQHRLQCRL